MSNILKVVDRINRFAVYILSVLVLIVMITGVYEVSMRYLFNRPTSWVWEMNGLLLSVMVSLGGGYVLLRNSHVRVDIVYQMFSTRTKAIIDVATSVFTFSFLGVLLWQSVIMAYQSVQYLEHSQTAFRPPIYPFKIILCIGIVMFLLQVIADVVRNLGIAVKGKGSAGHDGT